MCLIQNNQAGFCVIVNPVFIDADAAGEKPVNKSKIHKRL